MTNKDRGVTTTVSRNYYRMLEKTRNVLKSKYRINVSSNSKLTEMMCHASPVYENKKWIQKIRGLKI